MKKTILALALMVTFASCTGAATEAEAPKADSTVVAVDSVACTVDTTCVVTSTAVVTTTI